MPDRLVRLVHELGSAPRAIVAVSPHLDDVVLSCGALLAYLARRRPVTVVTVFTEAAPPPWSLPARRYLRIHGTDAESLFEQRRAEDVAVLADLGAAVVHLGLRDALFRRVGEAAAGSSRRRRRSVYPTFRFDAARGRIARADAELPAAVAARIGPVVRASGAGIVFAPLGVGRHVDHLITRGAMQGLEARIIYYSDFPYSETAVPDPGFVRDGGLVPHPWLSGRAENVNRISRYRAEFPLLFPRGTVPVRPEMYWIPR